LALILIRS